MTGAHASGVSQHGASDGRQATEGGDRAAAEATSGVRERALRLAHEVFARGLASAASPGRSDIKPEPRPHQLDAVSALLEAVYWDGAAPAPVNYLLQHSTGSGKSFTIAALAVALAGWADCAGGRVGTVLVLNDRLQLDRQLGDCVEAFWRGNGRPAGGLRRASSTAELSGFLSAPLDSPGRPALILTTVQKLATLWRAGGGRARQGAGAGAAAGGNGGGGGLARIAVIADEAHRHHGHGTTDQIHQILAGALGSESSGPGGGSGAGTGGGGCGPLSKRPQTRQQPRGLTYFGFTATPSPKALQLFGVCREVPADPRNAVEDEEGAGTDGGDNGGGGANPGGDGGGSMQTGPPALQERRPPQQQQQQERRRQSSVDAVLAEGHDGRGGGGGGTAEEETPLLYSPYHSYSMRSAVRDGFVLDVLRSYTAVTPRLQIAGLRDATPGRGGGGPGPDAGPPGGGGSGGGGGGPQGSAAEGQQLAEEVLVEAASNSRDVVERKAIYIVQRFVALWRSASAAGFTSFRGMVVARSRQHVVWFVQALRRAVAEEPEFTKLAEAAAATDPRDAASSRRGPSVFGAFSGAIPLPAAELTAECRQWRQTAAAAAAAGAGRGGGGGGGRDPGGGGDEQAAAAAAAGLEAADGDDDHDKSDEERPRKRRRRAVGSSEPDDGGGGGGGRRRPTGRSGGSVRAQRAASGWDAALSHLDSAAAAAGGTTHGSVADGDDPQPSRMAARRARGGGSSIVARNAEGCGGSDSEDGAAADDQGAGSGSGSGSGSAEGSQGGSDDGGGGEGESGSRSDDDGDSEWRSDDWEGSGSGSASVSESESESESEGGSGSGSGSGAQVGSGNGDEDERSGGSGGGVGCRKGGRGGGGGGGRGRGTATAAAAGKRLRIRTGPGTATDSDARRTDSEQPSGTAGGGGGGVVASHSSLFGSDSAAAAAPTPSGRGQEAAPLQLGRRGGSVQSSEPQGLVRRQASRLTVTSRAAPAAGSGGGGDAAAAGAAPAAFAAAVAAEVRGGESMEVGDVTDGGSGAAGADIRRRVMTRAMSSSAVALASGDSGGGKDRAAPVVRQPSVVQAAVQVTEADVNGRGADPGAARLLVVCSKYETGYDDPRLGAMFIDRTLSGARAVQVLGRLNRPAPALAKSPALLGVVDFVNSVGGLREAFEEFYDVTYLHTGKAARRLRQERQLERSLARILEALQPAADRAAAAAAAGTAGGGPIAGAAAAAAGGLLSLSVSQMAALAGWGLAPEARRALEDDLGSYVALAGSLRLEMAEMPLPFAAALLARLTADREARERASAALRASSAAAADGDDDGGGGGGGGVAGGGGTLPDVQVAVCELEETFSGAIYLAPAPPPGAAAGGNDNSGGNSNGGSVGGGGGRAAAAAAPPASVAAAMGAAPLRGRPIQGGGRGWAGRKAAGGGGRGRYGNSGGGGGASSSSLDRKVRKDRPLSEVIAAANAALDGRYERKLAAGFKEVCARLTAATATAAAAAAAASPEEGGGGSAATAAPSVLEGGGEGAAATAATGEDLYELLSLLRRLSLWPITVDLLRVTNVGREVAKLKKHACPQVANLARTLVARWKSVTAAAAAKAATTSAGKAARTGNGGRAATPTGAAAAAGGGGSGTAGGTGGTATGGGSGTAVDEQLRGKVRTLLEGSLRTHVEAAARIRSRDPHPTDLDPERLGLAARELEVAVFAAHGADGTSYKSQTRMLVGALKHADGVAAGLLSGATDPRVMATADSMALAPASVRAQAEEVARKKRLEMEAWEKLAGQGGGASTYKSAATVCPSCGGSGATVHNVLSGGTYAQERTQIQKFVCDHCGNTWRND